MNTSELKDAALDWAVAKCAGYDTLIKYAPLQVMYTPQGKRSWYIYRPTTNWAQGGPIIERESIRLMPEQGATYVDCVWLAGNANEDGDEFNGEGPTPLIAAMRCYVASKMGDEIDLPKELT